MRWQTSAVLAVLLVLVGGFYYLYEVRWAADRERAESRKGRVFADRYHVSVLENPTLVRNALGYVLRNAEKHGVTCSRDGIDPFSSAASFDGWNRPLDFAVSSSRFGHAQTWLIKTGWRRLGLLDRAGPTQRESAGL